MQCNAMQCDLPSPLDFIIDSIPPILVDVECFETRLGFFTLVVMFTLFSQILEIFNPSVRKAT